MNEVLKIKLGKIQKVMYQCGKCLFSKTMMEEVKNKQTNKKVTMLPRASLTKLYASTALNDLFLMLTQFFLEISYWSIFFSSVLFS